MISNSKSFLDDNYTVSESTDVKAVMTRLLSGGNDIGQILNMSKDIVKSTVIGSAEKAIVYGCSRKRPEECF